MMIGGVVKMRAFGVINNGLGTLCMECIKVLSIGA